MSNFIESCRVGFSEYLNQQSDVASFQSVARSYWDALPYEWQTGAYRDSLNENEQKKFDALSPSEQERIAFDYAKDGFRQAYNEFNF